MDLVLVQWKVRRKKKKKLGPLILFHMGMCISATKLSAIENPVTLLQPNTEAQG